MQIFRKVVIGMLLSACVVAQAQNAAHPSSAQTVKTRTAKPKTEEQILLEQLNEKFQKLDQLNEKLDDLEQKYDALQKQMNARDGELEQARKDAATAQAAAAEAKQKLEATQKAIGPEGSNVTSLQTDVAALKVTSTSLSAKVETTAEATKKLENADTIHFKGVDLTPGGFLAAETVDRQRAVGGDVDTPFNSIPFAGQTAGVLSEFNASGRQSRLSLLIEGKLPSATLRGYVETDFLSAGTTSNDNQSNSYTLRLRQAWAQAALNNGWTITGGQMWSLATAYQHGLDNLS
jgi:DNA repair ATPase RecN